MKSYSKIWKAAVILILVVYTFKGFSAFRNRPSALYQRWMGSELPGDVTNLRGNYKFYLTESVAWLAFNAPPSRIAAIVDDNKLREVVPEVPWHVEVASRRVSLGSNTTKTAWFGLVGWQNSSLPEDLQVYWQSSNGIEDTSSGWALYYNPNTSEAFWTLQTF